MNYETKRSVFEECADECAGLDDEIYNQYMQRYDTATPDDLPTIPNNVSNWIKHCQGSTNLLGMLFMASETYQSSEVMAWVIARHDTFAIAWVLGAWRVKETGEIVKVEAEK